MTSVTEMDNEPSNSKIKDIIIKIKNKKLDEASVSIDELLTNFPNSSLLYSLRGTIELSKSNYDKAIKCFLKAKENNPNRKEVYFDLGTAYELKIEYEAAAENFLKVLEIDKDHLASLNSLGNLYLKINDIQKAALFLSQAVELKPDSAPVLNNLGNLKKVEGEFKDAIKYYKSALDIEENFTSAKRNMASCFLALKDYNSAGVIYSEIGDKFSNAKYLECLLNLSEYDKFFSIIQEVGQKDPYNLWMAALSAYASDEKSVPDIYPFCRNPLDYIHFSNLRTHLEDYKTFIGSLLNEMNELNSEWEPRNKTTKKGFQTANDLFSLNSENLNVLKAVIINEMQSYRFRFKQSNNLLIKNFPEKGRLNGWYVKLVKQGHQDSHIHPTGWVSGVIYLKTIQGGKGDEGAIQFGLHGYNYPKPSAEVSKLTWLPNDGDLVLFPSSLFHNTVPVKQDCERCVIAFDFVPG